MLYYTKSKYYVLFYLHKYWLVMKKVANKQKYFVSTKNALLYIIMSGNRQ